MKLNDESMVIVALAGIAVVMLSYVAKNAKEVGQAVGTATVDLANGVITGTVTGIGEAVGVPKTSQTECEKAKAEGRTWDASFACAAGDFLSYWWAK